MIDDVEDNTAYQCVDCSCWSPKTASSHTLISSKFGWRLSRTRSPEGRVLLEWRCPKCWAKHRAQRISTATTAGGIPAFNPSNAESSGFSEKWGLPKKTPNWE